MRVDMGDKLRLSDALCEALGVPTGTLEPNQCVLLHTALALLGWECGPPELLGLPPADRIQAATGHLRVITLNLARWWKQVLGAPRFPITSPEGELLMQCHDSDEVAMTWWTR